MGVGRFDLRLLVTPLRGTFTREDQIPKFLEIMRWPNEITCPHCRSQRVMRFLRTHRKLESGYLYYCRRCRRQFAVTTCTALHHTHVPLEKWVRAVALIRGSSRELTAATLARNLGVTYKTGLLMCRRLRRGMKGPFVRNLFIALRSYRTSEIFHNLFPDLYEPSMERNFLVRAAPTPRAG